nr:hypothetical protein Iba_chr04fCG7600 [Ipomoea batatas]
MLANAESCRKGRGVDPRLTTQLKEHVFRPLTVLGGLPVAQNTRSVMIPGEEMAAGGFPSRRGVGDARASRAARVHRRQKPHAWWFDAMIWEWEVGRYGDPGQCAELRQRWIRGVTNASQSGGGLRTAELRRMPSACGLSMVRVTLPVNLVDEQLRDFGTRGFEVEKRRKHQAKSDALV